MAEPTMPLRGEADPEDVGLGRGLSGLGPGPDVEEEESGSGVAAGLPAPGDDLDPGTSGPGRTPDLEGGAATGATVGLDDDSDLESATGRGTVPGFAGHDRGSTSGLGGVPERGTAAGIGTVKEGQTGGDDRGLEGTDLTGARSTTPLSRQGSITGVDDDPITSDDEGGAGEV